jgi:hypothetical protein
MAAQREFAARAVEWIEEHVPHGSVIIADRPLQDVLHYYGHWRLAEVGMLTGAGRGMRRAAERRAADGEQRPSPMQPDRAAKLRARYEGLSSRERSRAAFEDLLAYAGDARAVYWIGRERDVRNLMRRVRAERSFEKIGEFEVPGGEDGDGSRLRGVPFGPGGMRPGESLPGPGALGPGGPLGGPGGRRPGGAGMMAGRFSLRAGSWEVFRLAPS